MPAPDTDETGAGATGSAPDAFERSDPPAFSLRIWPYRSLTRRGFGWVIGLLAFGLALPLMPLIGTNAAWGLLPFLLAALLALYVALKRSYFDGRVVEELRLWPDLITVERRDPDGRVRRWHANPFWVRLALHEDARIEKYLTLRGNGREIELGAFLSPEERVALHHDIAGALARITRAPGPASGGENT